MIESALRSAVVLLLKAGPGIMRGRSMLSGCMMAGTSGMPKFNVNAQKFWAFTKFRAYRHYDLRACPY